MPKRVLMAAGMFLLVMGTIWGLQGLGVIRWPPESFMLDRSDWALYGAITAGVGAVLLWLGRNR